MIRLVALACGLLCGIAIEISGLYNPSLLGDFLLPAQTRDITLGLGLVSALVTAILVLLVARRVRQPLLGGTMERDATLPAWKPLAGGLLFGLGWGLAGYFPMAALVALGLFAPGTAMFLVSVLAGMILHDVAANGGKLNIEGIRSRG
jgi:uncharacterized protein